MLDDPENLDQHIHRLEHEVAHLRPAAFSDEPSPAKGMAMLRKGRAKNELEKARSAKRDDK